MSSALDPTLSAALNLIGVNVSQILAAVVIECIAFGVYTCLVIGTIAAITRPETTAPVTRGRSKKWLLLSVCATMYAIATTHLCLSLYTIFEDDKKSRAVQELALACIASTEVPAPCAPIPHVLLLATRARFGQVTSVLISVNIALSDAVVLWRALVLWSRHRAVLAVSALLMLTTLVLLVWYAAVYYHPGHVEAYVSAAAFTVSWLTNIWATALVMCKAWHYHRHVSAHLRAPLRTRAERALLLFVGSGVLYCLFWIPFTAANILVAVDWHSVARLQALARAGHAVQISGPQRLLQAMDSLATGALIDVVGIYPTAVVLLVELSGRAAQRVLSARDMPTLVSHTDVPQAPPAHERPVLHLHLHEAASALSAEDLGLKAVDGGTDDVENGQPRHVG